MSDTLDDFVKELTEYIFQETKEAYGEIVYERWQKPLYKGSMEDPDGYAHLRGVCGDSMEIFLRIEGEQVKEASFRTDGCGSSGVCGSFATEMAMGKNLDELWEITGDVIVDRLGGLPEEDRHCAFLAAETLHEALNHYMIKQARKDT